MTLLSREIKPISVKLVVEEIEQIPPLSVLLRRLRLGSNGFILGDFSAMGFGRYSYLGLAPSEVLLWDADRGGHPLERLNSACRRYRLAQEAPLPVPFVGGWVGYISYDLCRYIERLPDQVNHDISLALLRLAFYDTLLAWDHRAGKGYLLALCYPGQKADHNERLEHLRQFCRLPCPSDVPDEQDVKSLSPSSAGAGELVKRMEHNISPVDYLAKVARARQYIKAGDIFEVNLSQRFACGYQQHPAVLYYYLSRHNPADYSALLLAPGHAIVSASPELFLQRRGQCIITRPIKGTVPRGSNAEEDRFNAELLERSDKDSAELNMIIDLERNDLGSICRYGSVKVLEERIIEAHPTVYHGVATIAGDLRRDVSVAQILRATFPGGSITGAPKIRAMEIIDELEPTARSVYTGSIGWIGVDGNFDLNIAIRTIILAQNQAYVQVGGAVVDDSEPEAEYNETLAKAAALLRAVWATQNSLTRQGPKLTAYQPGQDPSCSREFIP